MNASGLNKKTTIDMPKKRKYIKKHNKIEERKIERKNSGSRTLNRIF